ncbi:hypothetical protein HanPI659440_Chr03g0116931 [Helianthus annuus]|nr:hypothetical protein HanPI659440_Chr03g0116931 [Helianthus annuus]
MSFQTTSKRIYGAVKRFTKEMLYGCYGIRLIGIQPLKIRGVGSISLMFRFMFVDEL